MQADASGAVVTSSDNPMNHVSNPLEGIQVHALDFFNLPSPHIKPKHMLALYQKIKEEAANYDGVVITHGTDTLEETAYFLDTMEVPHMPIVLTGAMRSSNELGSDGVAAAKRAISMIEKQVGAETTAAIVIEPIQGEGGFIVPAPGFLSTLAEWCTMHRVLFIADEVQAGFARTGTWFACEQEGVTPDLITMAKGIAGGMPLSAVTGRADIMDTVHGGGLGGTYGGNPVACAAALAAIDQMESLDLCGRARHIETIITETLSATKDELDGAGLPVIGDIRGRGAMMAVELVTPAEDGSPTREPNPDLTAAVAKAALAQGVVALTCGTYGNVLRLLPPLVIGDDLLRDGLAVLCQALKDNA